MEKDINFEDKLWKAADKLRKKVEVHEYKYIVLSLIFLRYLSFAFEERRKELISEFGGNSSEIDNEDNYLSEGVIYVPEKARWGYLVKHAHNAEIGRIIDEAIEILEEKHPELLKGAIPKKFSSINLRPDEFAYLINLFTNIDFGEDHRDKDVFGRIYEYFLGKFALAEGQKGGEFYTPRSITKLIVEALDIKPSEEKIMSVFDPACGSGGFFIAAIEKLKKEGIPAGEVYRYIDIYGQESKEFTAALCRLNLLLRRVTGDIRVGDSYHEDKFLDKKFDFVLSNPPFNDSEWGRDLAKDDKRYVYGLPPENNANYAWIQIYIYHLNENGKAGFVMANGSLSTTNKDELEIRKKIIEDDLVYAIVTTPPKLFHNVSLPVSLWFVRKKKPEHMKGKILFINAKNLYKPISRKQNIFTEEHIQKIKEKFELFEKGEFDKINEVGFAKVVDLEEVRKNNYVLTPGRYVGVKIEDNVNFKKEFEKHKKELEKLLEEEKVLSNKVKEVIEEVSKLNL